jgi:hypothetical protein
MTCRGANPRDCMADELRRELADTQREHEIIRDDNEARRVENYRLRRELAEMHGKAAAMMSQRDEVRLKLAEAREWIGASKCIDSCDARWMRIDGKPHPCTCGRDALLAALEVPRG